MSDFLPIPYTVLPAHRRRFGFSQAGMAKALGVAPRTYRSWERGVKRMSLSSQAILHVMLYSDDACKLIMAITGAKPSRWLAAHNAKARPHDAPPAARRRPSSPVAAGSWPGEAGKGTRAGG